MGQGRRMKTKQGPPAPLSEEHFAKLRKRKGGAAEEPPAVEAPPSKRRRAAAKKDAQAVNGKSAKSNGIKAPVKAGKKAGKKDKSPTPELDDEDDGIDEEALSDLDMDDIEKLGDDFLGSDDDSVLDSDEEFDRKKEQFVFSDDEDDSDQEEKLTAANIEGLSAKLDKEAEEDRIAAELELQEAALQTNIEGDRPDVLDEEDDELTLKTKSLLAPDLQLLRQRITDTIRVLDDFSKLAEPGRSRAEYTERLLKDICSYYNYSPYLAEKLYNLFTPREAFAFFEANETPRPVVIRTNTLRTHRRDLAQALINRGVTLEPVGKWSKVGLQVFESSVPIGATPEYLAGHYIVQAASSFLPVMALAPQEHERVLDMAAAPGGKSTHMAALMKNTGVIFANDPNKSRAKGLIGNIHRLGVRNAIVCSYDAREFPKVMGGFDRVLLDAPCTGTGVVAKDPSVKTNKDEKDFMAIPHMQKQLLLAAIDSVDHSSKTGGYIVYSTCSVAVEENEQVVAYALSRRPNVRLVETGLPFGKEGFTSFMGKNFPPSLKLTRRYYPHTYNVDGFFVAKFQKTGPTPPNAVQARSNGVASTSADKNGEEVIDKTPITAEEAPAQHGEAGGFSEFDDEEDQKYIERAKRNALRKKGVNPKADKSKAKSKA